MSNSEEKLDAIETETAAEETANEPDQAERASKRKRRSIVAGVVVAVVVAAAAGLMVWHEQPSFCAAICHDPMDPYLPTYEATPGESGTDKWATKLPILPRCLPPCTARLAKPAWIATFPS